MCCHGFAFSLALFVILPIIVVKIISLSAFHLQFWDLFACKAFMENFLEVEVSGQVLRRAALKQISVVNI
jgi:hypothetical protein